MPEASMTVGDWISAAANVVSSAAIVVGAVWGYFKFVRGRTFAHRAELGVTGELLQADDARAIRAVISLRNTGAKDIPLRAKVVYVYAVRSDTWAGDRSPKWTKVAVEPVFAQHDSVEAQESLSDEVLIPVPNEPPGEPLAYRLELRVYEKRKRPGATQWTSEGIVPSGLQDGREGEEEGA